MTSGAVLTRSQLDCGYECPLFPVGRRYRKRIYADSQKTSAAVVREPALPNALGFGSRIGAVTLRRFTLVARGLPAPQENIPHRAHQLFYSYLAICIAIDSTTGREVLLPQRDQ